MLCKEIEFEKGQCKSDSKLFFMSPKMNHIHLYPRFIAFVHIKNSADSDTDLKENDCVPAIINQILTFM